MAEAETMKNPATPVEESEALSLTAERAAVNADRREIKGRLYDLQFDGLDEAKLEEAKGAILQEHQVKEDKYKADVKSVREQIAAEKSEIAKIKAAYVAKIENIKATEHNPSDEEIAKAKEVYASSVAKENSHFKEEISRLNSEIASIKEQSKQECAVLKQKFNETKKTPMKRADKAAKLDEIKSEIYKNSGTADLQTLERNNKIRDLKISHKKISAKLANDLHLETNRVQTLVANAKAEEKVEVAPIKEKLHDLEANYKPVAPLHEKIAIGTTTWARKWVAKEKISFSSWKGFGDWFIHNAVYLIILLMVIVTAIQVPAWFNFDSFIAIVKHTSSLLPLALGVAGTIVLTGTDLSLGRIWGFTALLSASLLGYASTKGVIFPWTASMPWIWILVVLLASMLVGGICGALNGFFVAEFSIHPFVVTLATQLIIYGAVLLYGNQLNLSVAFQGTSSTAAAYTNFVSSGFYIGTTLVEWYNVYAIIMLIVMSFIWYKTKFGKAMFAVGCNPDAANVSGINVNKTIITTFILAGIFYGIAGFEYNPINGGAQLSTGTGGELDPITAVVIGGVSFTGGIGKVSGVLLGCILLKVIDSCLLALGANTAWINIAKGAIILFAVALDMKKYIVKK